MAASTPEIDVLIVGGGPSGLMTALELSANNINYRLINAAPVRSNKSRAMVLHSRSLEVLSRHGIANKFLERGTVNFGSRIYANRKFVLEMWFKDSPFPDTSFPFPLIISQAETEGVLDAALAEKYGKNVEMGITAESVVQDDGGVTTVLKHADGRKESVRSRYIIGCDGAHSIVRKAAGIKFEGSVYPQDFILADVHLDWEMGPSLNMFMGQGFVGVFPMREGLHRLVCTRPQHINSDTEPVLQDFQDVLDALVPGKSKVSDPAWISRFRIHHRIAESYSRGRVFLVGDAAHIHSPAGGQGMNTGLQDAVNLCWKLARVIKGSRPPSFLDSYNTERRKVGQQLLKRTDAVFEFMATTNPLYLWLRNTLVPWIAPWAMRNAETRRDRFRFMSQLAIRYRNSPLVGQLDSWTGDVKGGDRAPDGKLVGSKGESTFLELCRKPIHHLMLFSGVGSAAMDADALLEGAKVLRGDDDLELHVILRSGEGNGNVDSEGELHTRYGFNEPGYALVRPDGHVAFIGGMDSIEEFKLWWEAQKVEK